MYEAFHGGAGSCPIDISRHQCPGRAGGQRTDLQPREDNEQKVMNQPSHICSTICFNSKHPQPPSHSHILCEITAFIQRERSACHICLPRFYSFPSFLFFSPLPRMSKISFYFIHRPHLNYN